MERDYKWYKETGRYLIVYVAQLEKSRTQALFIAFEVLAPVLENFGNLKI